MLGLVVIKVSAGKERTCDVFSWALCHAPGSDDPPKNQSKNKKLRERKRLHICDGAGRTLYFCNRLRSRQTKSALIMRKHLVALGPAVTVHGRSAQFSSAALWTWPETGWVNHRRGHRKVDWCWPGSPWESKRCCGRHVWGFLGFKWSCCPLLCGHSYKGCEPKLIQAETYSSKQHSWLCTRFIIEVFR